MVAQKYGEPTKMNSHMLTSTQLLVHCFYPNLDPKPLINIGNVGNTKMHYLRSITIVRDKHDHPLVRMPCNACSCKTSVPCRDACAKAWRKRKINSWNLEKAQNVKEQHLQHLQIINFLGFHIHVARVFFPGFLKNIAKNLLSHKC